MGRGELIKLVLGFMERNPAIAVITVSMGVVAFALYVVLYTVSKL